MLVAIDTVENRIGAYFHANAEEFAQVGVVVHAKGLGAIALDHLDAAELITVELKQHIVLLVLEIDDPFQAAAILQEDGELVDAGLGALRYQDEVAAAVGQDLAFLLPAVLGERRQQAERAAAGQLLAGQGDFRGADLVRDDADGGGEVLVAFGVGGYGVGTLGKGQSFGVDGAFFGLAVAPEGQQGRATAGSTLISSEPLRLSKAPSNSTDSPALNGRCHSLGV